MKCPFCGYEESKVVDSRHTDEGTRIRRRRECLKCSSRFTTYEVVESLPIVVVKRDKSREVFNRDKLLGGLLKSCEKRPVSMETLERAVEEIEARLQNSLDREITSQQIGAARIALTRYTKRGGQVWIKIFPDKPVTEKPAETRMGSGKGSPEYWVAVVKPGRVLFEIAGVPEDVAREALRLASHKLPLKTKILAREDNKEAGGEAQ